MSSESLAEELSVAIWKRVAAPVAAFENAEDCAFLSFVKLRPLGE
jgi:hypothetical protein